MEIDRKKVTDAQGAEDAFRKAKGSVLLRIWSEEGTRFVVVSVGVSQ